jgi:hypothetical protein
VKLTFGLLHKHITTIIIIIIIIMHQKSETDIWFVFRILEFEVNYGDLICVTYFVCGHDGNLKI